MARLISENFEQQKSLILGSAVHAFATEGFANSSMNRIAERAGVSKSLIYHYYPNKETLLFEAMTQYLTSVHAALAAGSEEPSLAGLRAKLRRLLGEYRAAKHYHVVLMNELRNLSDLQRSKVIRLQKEVTDSLQKGIAAAAPVLTDGEQKAATMLMLGMVNWIYTWYSDKGPVNHSQLADLVDQMVAGAVEAIAQRRVMACTA